MSYPSQQQTNNKQQQTTNNTNKTTNNTNNKQQTTQTTNNNNNKQKSKKGLESLAYPRSRNSKKAKMEADRILMTEIVKGKLQLTHRTDRFQYLISPSKVHFFGLQSKFDLMMTLFSFRP